MVRLSQGGLQTYVLRYCLQTISSWMSMHIFIYEDFVKWHVACLHEIVRPQCATNILWSTEHCGLVTGHFTKLCPFERQEAYKPILCSSWMKERLLNPGSCHDVCHITQLLHIYYRALQVCQSSVSVDCILIKNRKHENQYCIFILIVIHHFHHKEEFYHSNI